ncbi:MAG: M20 family metallopeptidase [Bacteroidetes bacterium]|nr:M20 family metallopeptidase [Bacteroidota bacterium]
MQNTKTEIQNLANKLFPEMVSIRHHFHMNPELSTEEYQTAEFICEKLDEAGITYSKNIGGTGIVAIIEGKNPLSKNIALRADMDALPVVEENEVDYKSKISGKMHACGHDVHMTCLLGAGMILNTLKDQFNGSIKLIFQPSEETYPGGAIKMIGEGVLKNPKTQTVIGQHVTNEFDAGKIGVRSGLYMASTDEVFLTVRGKGGHAATPDQVIDPILIASHIIIAIQQIVSRNANPIVPTVVSFGKIIGEGRTNIIPDEVLVAGTIRTFDESWQVKIHEKIAKLSSSIAEGMGGSCETRISHGYPALVNDDQLTAKIRSWAIDYLGENNVLNLEKRMTAEDFAYFAKEVPSSFYRLGTRNEQEGKISNLHTSTFDIDENSILTGMGFMAYSAIRFLTEG